MKFVAWVGADGERYTQDGCNCDMDQPCNDVRCVMERERELAYMFAQYNHQQRIKRTQTDPNEEESYVDAMRHAGRGHLLHPRDF